MFCHTENKVYKLILALCIILIITCIYYNSIIGLHVYENLTVSIAAMTAEGWGPYSVHHYFTTLEDGIHYTIEYDNYHYNNYIRTEYSY